MTKDKDDKFSVTVYLTISCPLIEYFYCFRILSSFTSGLHDFSGHTDRHHATLVCRINVTLTTMIL